MRCSCGHELEPGACARQRPYAVPDELYGVMVECPRCDSSTVLPIWMGAELAEELHEFYQTLAVGSAAA